MGGLASERGRASKGPAPKGERRRAAELDDQRLEADTADGDSKDQSDELFGYDGHYRSPYKDPCLGTPCAPGLHI